MIDKDDLDNAEKILLLLIGGNRGEPIPGNLWMQKEAFQLAQSIESLKEFFGFEAHFQGPYSETVGNIVEDLEYLGLVDKDRHGIKLTKKGKDIFEEVYSGTDQSLLEEINDTKRLFNDLSKDELLVYIYYSNPEMTTESLEKEDLEPKRESVARRLYEKQKVDLEKAADLAGVEPQKFISG